MATKSFGSKRTNEEAPTASADPQPSTEAPSSEVATTTSGESALALTKDANGGGFAGDWSREDVRLPRVNLVHKTSDGEMIEKFGIGSFALDKSVKLSDGKTPFVIGVVRAAKDYQQKLPYGDPATPNVVNTPEEVTKIGGSMNYADVKSGKFYGPRAHLQIIFALPEGASEEDAALFPYEFEGTPYAMALLTVASSAYTSVGKELATLCNNNTVMRKGMAYGKLELTSETRKKGDLDWKIPVIKFVGENPAALVAFYQSLL